ncbi:MAG: transglycosylase domain-containing protein, partial [Parvularculaceae bacterium]
MTEPPKAPEKMQAEATDDAARPVSAHDAAGRDASDISARAREEAARLAAEFRDAASELSSRLKSLHKAAGQILPSPKRVAPPARTSGPIRLGGSRPCETGDRDKGDSPSVGAESPVAATPGMHNAPAGEPASGDDDNTSTTTSGGGAELSAPKRPDATPSAAERARARRSQSATKPSKAASGPATPKPGAAKPSPRKRMRPAAAALAREIALPLLSLGFIGLIGGLYLTFVILAPRPPEGVDLWAVNRLPSVVILDRNGREVAARGARYGEAVPVGELPPFLIKAFLSTEDRRYYQHRGVDLRGIARAFVTNLKSGGVREGGSTITQQLARNLFLTPEQSYTRKAKEALLALWLEGRYSKDEILSLYLNRIYLGAGAYGIESAAKTYFGKSARDVTLGEAAMLAGLPKAPSTLAPTLNPEGAQDRAFDVIDNLQETGEITAFEAREARKTPPVVTGGGEDEDFGYFFDYVSAKARDIAGPDAIDLVITTTIDQKLQRDAEAAVKLVLNVDAKLAGAGQAALIAYDTGGAVRAMVGGRSYVESQFNRATQAKRQSGSAFKPFVYAAAFENGLEPKTRFTDQPIDVDGWRPTNYGDTYAGPMRLTEAMAKSVNSVAVQVSERIGRRKVVEMAHRLGVRSDLPAVPSIALGAANVSLDELTAAYLPFARHGMSAEPYAILKIGDGLGGVI